MKQLPISTRLFLISIYAIGASLIARNMINMEKTDPVMLGGLCVLGAILHILKVEGATNRSHYTISFLVYGFTLVHFGLPEAILVILVSNLAEWVWNRPAWYIQLFNIGCYAVAAEAAGLISSAINPAGSTTSWVTVLAIVAAMAGFTFINHLVVGIIVWLARGENFKQSGVFELITLIIDLTMMSIGAGMAIVWDYNPYALLIFLVPAYPLYMTLKIPALERKTEIDQKTGLFNHPYFMEQLKNELLRAHRYDRPLAIIMADLDLLRNINNTYGHLAGDEVLKGVANILKRSVRDYDIVARFGGEEFAILMPETEIEKALERAEYIRNAIQAARFVIPTSVDPIKATMSFGVAKRENFGQSGEEILHHADTALYRSKLSGRNRSLALVEDSFLAAGSQGAVQQTGEELSASSPATGDDNQKPEYAAASTRVVLRDRKSGSQPAEKNQASPPPPEAPEFPRTSTGAIVNLRNYIGLLAISAALAWIAITHYLIPLPSNYSLSDWIGFTAIAGTIILTECFSINLYVRNTSLSTSAVPIITLFILFGPLGTLVASAVFAVTAAIKFRSRVNRIVFNSSNHLMTGIVINILTRLVGINTGDWKHPHVILILALGASLILFIGTTTLIAIAISLDMKQSPFAIWREQYQWMWPYYLGMGFLSFALMFGYVYAGLVGILTMLIPLALLRLSQAQYVEHTRVIVNEVRQKNRELEQNAVEINEMNEGLLRTLSEIIDLRDPYVLGHSNQVSKYATEIAGLLGLNEKQIDLIRKASLLHDIGKLGISMEILTKPSKLTATEYEILKSHAALGGELVKNTPSLRALVPIIRHHHEYYNGWGYPDRLARNQIPIEARIVAVADAIEAMTSDRPYHKGFQFEQAIEELTRCSGTQFDPQVVAEAVEMLKTMIAEERAASPQSQVEINAGLIPQLAINA